MVYWDLTMKHRDFMAVHEIYPANSTGNRQSRSFFKEMSIFSCVEAFPGSRAFLQNASKLWWSQRNHVFKCFCVFSCVQLGFRYLVMLRVYVVFVAFSWGETFLLQLLSYQWLLYVQLYLATTVKLLLNCWLLLSCCRWLLPNCCWIASELLPTARLTSYQVTWSRITPACAQCFV